MEKTVKVTAMEYLYEGPCEHITEHLFEIKTIVEAETIYLTCPICKEAIKCKRKNLEQDRI